MVAKCTGIIPIIPDLVSASGMKIGAVYKRVYGFTDLRGEAGREGEGETPTPESSYRRVLNAPRSTPRHTRVTYREQRETENRPHTTREDCPPPHPQRQVQKHAATHWSARRTRLGRGRGWRGEDRAGVGLRRPA